MNSPKLLTETVTVQYWGCGVKGHRHKKEKAAAACIVRHRRRGQPKRKTWTEEDRAVVFFALLDGETLAQAGERFSRSGTWARDMALRLFWSMKSHRIKTRATDELPAEYERYGRFDRAKDRDFWVAEVDAYVYGIKSGRPT